MSDLNYWIAAVEAGLEDCTADGKLTPDEIRHVADSVMGAFEVYHEATGRSCIPNPLYEENKNLRKELDIERQKVVCPECRGKGRIVFSCGTITSDSQCSACRGEGYRLP